MNKRELQQAISKGHMFTGAIIPLEAGERLLGYDMLMIIKQMEADKNRITAHNLGELHPVIELVKNQLLFNWVLVPSSQGQISDKPSANFDEAIKNEIQEKIQIATKIALTAIDLGNKIATDSSNKSISATEVLRMLRGAEDPQIVGNVVARAKGPQRDLFFENDFRQLGGIADAQTEFTNSESHRVLSSHVVRWISERDVILSTETIPDNQHLAHFFNKNKFCIRVAQGTKEAAILRCALFAECSLDVDICIGFDIKKRKQVLHLARIIDHLAIFNQARELINELDG